MIRLIEFYHLNDNLLFEQSCFKKAYILQVNFIFIEVNHIKNLKYFLYKSNMFEALKKTLHNEIKIFGINLRSRFVQLCISGGKDVHGRIVGRSKKIHASHAD